MWKMYAHTLLFHAEDKYIKCRMHICVYKPVYIMCDHKTIFYLVYFMWCSQNDKFLPSPNLPWSLLSLFSAFYVYSI